MAVLEKLSIRGIRSFGTDPEDEQVSRPHLFECKIVRFRSFVFFLENFIHLTADIDTW